MRAAWPSVTFPRAVPGLEVIDWTKTLEASERPRDGDVNRKTALGGRGRDAVASSSHVAERQSILYTRRQAGHVFVDRAHWQWESCASRRLSKTVTSIATQWRHYRGDGRADRPGWYGPPRVTPSRGWHPKEKKCGLIYKE